MRLSLLLLLALAVPAGLFAGTVSLTFTGGTVLPGETISSSVILDHSSNATGWAYSACHDPAVVELSTFSLGASGLVVNGGEPPDFLEIQQTAEGWSHGAIVSSFGLFSLSGGVHELGVAEYQGVAAGVTTICPCELDVVPPPTTVIVYSGVSVAPVEICGDITVPEGRYFVRGDANVDGSVDVGDAIEILNTLFGGGGATGCLEAADVNADSLVDIADPIALLAYFFSEGAAPSAPFPECGADPSVDCALGTICL